MNRYILNAGIYSCISIINGVTYFYKKYITYKVIGKAFLK